MEILYKKYTKDKKFNNNLQFAFDVDHHEAFGAYGEANKGMGQSHDAGYDAFMTGYIFGVLAKFIEIGQIVAPYSQDSGKSTVPRLTTDLEFKDEIIITEQKMS